MKLEMYDPSMGIVFSTNKDILDKIQKELNEWAKAQGKVTPEQIREKFDELWAENPLRDPFWDEDELLREEEGSA